MYYFLPPKNTKKKKEKKIEGKFSGGKKSDTGFIWVNYLLANAGKTRDVKTYDYRMLLSFKTLVTYKCFFNFLPGNCIRCEASFVRHNLIFLLGIVRCLVLIFRTSLVSKKISFVLIITCLGGRYGLNCPSVFFKTLKLPEWNQGNFKIVKNHKGDLSEKSAEPNMWLLFNHTKPTNTLYWN